MSAFGSFSSRTQMLAGSGSSWGLACPVDTLFAGVADRGISFATDAVRGWTSSNRGARLMSMNNTELQPTYTPAGGSGPGGRAYLSSPGGRYLSSGSVATAGTWALNGPFTMFAVIRAASQTATVLSVGVSLNNHAAHLRVSSGGRVQVTKRGDNTISVSTSADAYSTTNWALIGAVCHGETLDIYAGVNTTPAVSGSAFVATGELSTPSRARIFGGSSEVILTGDVAAAAIDDRDWDSGEIEAFMDSVDTYYGGAVT